MSVSFRWPLCQRYRSYIYVFLMSVSFRWPLCQRYRSALIGVSWHCNWYLLCNHAYCTMIYCRINFWSFWSCSILCNPLVLGTLVFSIHQRWIKRREIKWWPCLRYCDLYHGTALPSTVTTYQGSCKIFSHCIYSCILCNPLVLGTLVFSIYQGWIKRREITWWPCLRYCDLYHGTALPSTVTTY